MNRKGIFITVIFLIVFIVYFADLINSRKMELRGSGGWGMENEYSRMYDPKTVETISGKVESIDMIKPKREMCYGVSLVVNSNKETIPVHVGPEWYIENQDIAVEPMDSLEIRGSKTTLDGKPIFIAAEIRKGNKMMILRDDKGFPRWSCWRSAKYN